MENTKNLISSSYSNSLMHGKSAHSQWMTKKKKSMGMEQKHRLLKITMAQATQWLKNYKINLPKKKERRNNRNKNKNKNTRSCQRNGTKRTSFNV